MADLNKMLDDLPMKLLFYVAGLLVGIFASPAINWLATLA